MSDATKQFLIRLSAVLVAGLVIAYVYALFSGQAEFPVALQTGVVTFFLLVLAAAGPSAAAFISTRASNRNASQTQQVVQDATHQTQQVVHEATTQAKQEIREAFHNGGGDAIAQKVVDQMQQAMDAGSATPRDPELRERSSDRRDQ